MTRGTDGRLEHEVELFRLGQLVLRFGVADVELSHELSELRSGVVVNLIQERTGLVVSYTRIEGK